MDRMVFLIVDGHPVHEAKSVKFFAEEVGKNFHRGLVLYTGKEAIPIGPRLQALPVDALWRLPGLS